VTALVCGVAVLLFVVAKTLSDSGDSGGRPAAKGHVLQGQKGSKGSIQSAYVVQNGDTLTSIAHETGVPVSEILKLNPGVDPQILISGEKLKLR
jgi:LysM repeat protein